MKKKKNLLGLVFLTFLCSCGLSPFEESPSLVMPEETNIKQETTLFKESESADAVVFEMNDSKYLAANGYTFWTVPFINDMDKFSPMSVRVCKESGRMEAGFGLVFCEQKINEKPFMLTALINTGGLYAIGKISDGVFSHINGGWKNSNYINKGYGVRNDISISFDDVKKDFMLKINGYEITAFATAEEIVFKDSRYGFAVVIANNENFPSDSVKVTFENKQ